MANPFLLFLILVPLLVSLIFTIGSVFGLLSHGPSWDIIFSIVMFSAISYYLILLLQRVSTLQGSLIEFPNSNLVNESIRRKVTSFLLTITYLVLFALAFLLFNIKSLKNWLGAGSFVLGLAMLLSGISYVQFGGISQLKPSDPSTANKLTSLESSLAGHLKARNYILLLHPILGVCLVLLYQFAGWTDYFSIWDLSGFLFLLASSCIWFILYGISMKKQVEALRKRIV